ncbi:hypothetical protein [Pseudoduganella buxea]|uniref:DUF3325 family protein n=1 Tax=Pseudoduganella buxea TaxID=1949069 RepID=A0A6I3SY76_9BURK|nr:hypothetical protein [Pseudoduganella buxea]MTV53999.1 hypothetical protein [Pseudoduganella buxea]GGC17402.1 hypothetical protein GCM10011572_43370 [Pseudoduganella buxea]
MSFLFLILGTAACAVLYLSHRHQRWLRQPLPAASRAAGVLLLAGALAAALAAWTPLTAVFAWLVLAMLAWSLLPFVPLLLPEDRDGR